MDSIFAMTAEHEELSDVTQKAPSETSPSTWNRRWTNALLLQIITNIYKRSWRLIQIDDDNDKFDLMMTMTMMHVHNRKVHQVFLDNQLPPPFPSNDIYCQQNFDAFWV